MDEGVPALEHHRDGHEVSPLRDPGPPEQADNGGDLVPDGVDYLLPQVLTSDRHVHRARNNECPGLLGAGQLPDEEGRKVEEEWDRGETQAGVGCDWECG